MRYRVWAKASDSDSVKVESFTDNEEHAVAIARAWMVAHQDDVVILDDMTGINPREYFARARNERGHMIADAQTCKEMWSAIPSMGYVEPGSAHDIVDLSRLA